LQELAVARMEGYSTEELAARQGIAPRTVERKLQKIRTLWAGQAPP
jgi:DNA-binding CsgD family transcriptional regulator